MLREVGRRANRGHPQPGSDPHRDHVLLQSLAKANARIVALCDDIGEAGLDVEFDLNVGMLGGQADRQPARAPFEQRVRTS